MAGVNAAKALTRALRDQRRRDLRRISREAFRMSVALHYRFEAWLMWGWPIESGGKALGVAGWTYPYWAEPRWLR